MQFILLYESAIDWLVAQAGGQDKFVHTYAGLLIWCIAAAIVGLSRARWLPLVPVAVLEGANEIVDRIGHGSWRWSDTSRDILATLFWPILLSGLLCFLMRCGFPAARE